MRELIDELIAYSQDNNLKITAIGVAIPGIVDNKALLASLVPILNQLLTFTFYVLLLKIFLVQFSCIKNKK